MAIRLTDRDLELLLTLARNGFLTVKQIQSKWFKYYNDCMRRLKQLRDEKYIDVVYIERFGSGIYHLTNNGLSFINDYYGYEYKNYSKNSKINHFVSCGEFYLNFPYEILEYKMEYDLDTFIPDIYIKYYHNKEIDLLVEIDNTAKTNAIKQKIINYTDYLDLKAWTEQFGKFPKCLIVSKGNFKLKDFNSKIPFIMINFKQLGELKYLL